MSDLDFNAEAARGRQQRLLAEMQKLQLDLVIVQTIEHVQWLTGARYPLDDVAGCGIAGRWPFDARRAAKAGARSGRGRRSCTYEAQWHSTLRNDQRQAASVELLKALASKAGSQPNRRRVLLFHAAPGGDSWRAGRYRADALSPAPPQRPRRAGPHSQGDRRHGEDVRPGPGDHRAGNHRDRSLQPPASGGGRRVRRNADRHGQRLSCGARGGPPRNNRKAQDGELYILDLGPAYRGYFADNSRAFAVNRKPTDEQQTAWTYVMKVFEHVEASRQARQELPGAVSRGAGDPRRGPGRRVQPSPGPRHRPLPARSAASQSRTGTTRSKSATSSPASRACTTSRSCGPACGWRTTIW